MERQTGTLDALLDDLDERGMTLFDLVEEVAATTEATLNDRDVGNENPPV